MQISSQSRALCKIQFTAQGVKCYRFLRHACKGTDYLCPMHLFRILFVLAVLLIGVGCDSSDERVDSRTVFRYNEATGIPTLDPAFAREQATIWAVKHVFSTLVELDSTLTPQPLVAASWKQEGLKWTFFLRQEVWFHPGPGLPKGRKLVASDVVYSYRRLADPALAAPGAWVLENVDTVYALSDSIVVVKVKKAGPSLLGFLAMAYCSLVPKESVDALGNQFGQHPVGTGPFVFKRWLTGEKLVFRKNNRYFERDAEGKSLPYLEAVSIRFVPDRQAAFLSYLKGDFDVVNGLDGSYKDQLFTTAGQLQPGLEKNHRLQKAPFLNTEYLAIVQDKPNPFYLRDVRVRKALSFAIDRPALVRHLKNNIGIPAHGAMIPAGLEGFRSEKEWKNPWVLRKDSAVYFLREVGLVDAQGQWKKKYPPLVLSTAETGRDVCEFIQSQWQSVGVPCRIEVLPAAAFRESKSQAGLGIFKGSWIADYPDPENYLSLFDSRRWTPAGPNYTRTASAVYDSWLDASLRASTREERLPYLYAMEEWVHSQVVVIPLWYDESVRVLRKNIRGVPKHPLFYLDLRRAYKESPSIP